MLAVESEEYVSDGELPALLTPEVADPCDHKSSPATLRVRRSRGRDPTRYPIPNGGGYRTSPSTPANAPGTSSRAMKCGPGNGDCNRSASAAENPKRG